ncbi:hypothetical protein CHUAL_012037 [Chamberlinius hualienensis]
MATKLYLLLIALLLVTTDFLSALPDKVRIGGLFETNEDPNVEKAFMHAIDRINSNRNVLGKSQLVPVTEVLTPDDSFHTSKKLCLMLRGGLAGVFGPRSPTSAAHVQSIADTLGVPHVEYRWDFRNVRHDFSLNLYPHPEILSKAYLDMVNEWKWKSFTLVYDDNQGLVRLQELLKAEFSEVKMFVRQMEATNDHRPLLKEMKKNAETRIVLDCSAERLESIFEQAQELGMINHYHSYLVTSLDLHTVNMSLFKNSNTNITALRIIQPNKVMDLTSVFGRYIFEPNLYGHPIDKTHTIKTEAALVFDAVRMFAKALNEVDKKFRYGFDIPPLYCNSSDFAPWSRGNDTIQTMRNMTMDGITGTIAFNSDGFRTNFILDIISYYDGQLLNAGVWNSSAAKRVNITRTQKEVEIDILRAIERHHFQVVVRMSEPYTMERKDPEKYSVNDRYEGYSIDLLKLIADYLKFNYSIKVVKDGMYGNKNADTGEWDGMIKELIEQEADIAIGDLTINYDRESAVDFTMPFMNLGISILYKKPVKKDPNLFSFMSPLSLDVWLYMGTAYLGVSVLLFLLARFSPYEWDSPHPCDPDPDVLENQFNLLNCMWFTIGSLMQQGCDFLPKAVSTRLVAGIWWFFTLIMISSYTANLAAFLTAERMDSPIESVEELAAQTKIKYGCQSGGTTESFFRESSLATYQTMWSVMESTLPSVFTKDNNEGVDRVKKGQYAYLIESTANEYFIERNCDLMQIGGLLDTKSYGVATPPGSPYRSLFSRAILRLQESGQLHVLKEKWWKKEMGGGKCPAEVASSGGGANELGLANVGGVFVVLLGGMALACMIGVVEFVWKTRQTVREARGSFWDEAKRELIFSLKCGTNKKPVNKKAESTDGLNVPLTNY